MSKTENQAWPPTYIVKQHPRAKHVKLKASAQKGLEIIVPPKYDMRLIPTILQQHEAWIRKQLSKLQVKLQARRAEHLPETLTLAAIEKSWKIEYISCDSKAQLIMRPVGDIVILGKLQTNTACRKLLTQCVKQLAKKFLVSMLQEMSELIQLPYEKVVIRDQKTRWGSCTHEKTISLNYKLLFLPPKLAKHILIHELCHTVHLNHSEKFWRLVAEFDEDWKVHRREVKQRGDDYMPEWLM